MTLAEKIVAIHDALERHRVPHAFGGAIALAYYTLDPRGTSDVDLNLFVPERTPEAALAALPEGIADRESATAAIVESGQVRLWWGENPVDLFFDTVPLHTAARANSRTVPFADAEIPILGPVELAAFKTLFNRTRDWADLEAMVAARTLDLRAAAAAVAEVAGRDDPRAQRLLGLEA
jgi:hypothetical protein